MPTPRTLHLVACDDEPAVLARVEQLLTAPAEGPARRLQTFADGYTLLRAAATDAPDIAILDIQMPGVSGIDLARRLLALCPHCQILFLTSHIAFCQDVYEVDHVAFVLKADMDTRLPAAVARACARCVRPAPAGPRLVLGDPGHALQLPERDILYLERRVRTTWVHALSDTYSTTEKLEPLLARLDPLRFCQTHKSFAIHWPYAERYEKDCIRVQGGAVLPVSRGYAAAVRRSFLEYLATLRPEESEVPL